MRATRCPDSFSGTRDLVPYYDVELVQQGVQAQEGRAVGLDLEERIALGELRPAKLRPARVEAQGRPRRLGLEPEAPLDDVFVAEDHPARHLEVDQGERTEHAEAVEDLPAERCLHSIHLSGAPLAQKPKPAPT